jgi:hypothetical protein
MLEDLRAAFRGLRLGKEQQKLAGQAIVNTPLVYGQEEKLNALETVATQL